MRTTIDDLFKKDKKYVHCIGCGNIHEGDWRGKIIYHLNPGKVTEKSFNKYNISSGACKTCYDREELKMRIKRRNKHQGLVDIIYEALKLKPYVKAVYRNIEYHSGELDILYITKGNKARYIEVKSNNTIKARNKAQKQFKRFHARFLLGHHIKGKKGLYYTPQTGFQRDLDVYH